MTRIEAILLNMVIRSEGVLHWHWKEENIEHVRRCERDKITSSTLDTYFKADRGYLVEYGSHIKEISLPLKQ